MSKKSELKKCFINLIDDIMDNYDKYSDEEKNEIKVFYEAAEKLNDKLESYDSKKSILEKYLNAFKNFFGGK